MVAWIQMLSLSGLLIAGGCATVSPVITKAIVEIGQDLIGSASSNYAAEYAQSVNQLLLAVAEVATGQPFTQPAYPTAYGQPGAYGSTSPYPTSQPYGTQPAYPPPDPNAMQPGYPQSDPYATQPSYPQSDPYGTPPTYPQSDPYATQPTYPPPADPYASQSGYPASSAPAAGYGQYGTVDYAAYTSAPVDYSYGVSPTQNDLSLDVTLLAESRSPDGRTTLRPVQDGESLRDGGTNPSAGDKIKLQFRASCACYLYIVGIDATGWVTQIHPERGVPQSPLVSGHTYLIPGGNEWWGLDSYKGVEQIYFVLSKTPLPQLEQALAAMPATRTDPTGTYTPVAQPAYFATRGMVKVHAAAPTDLPSLQTASTPITPDTFFAMGGAGQLVVTRWFQHI